MYFMGAGQVASQLNANSTSAQIFPLRVDSGGGSYSASATLPAQLPVPGAGRLEGRPFQVIVSGFVTINTTATTVLTLYASKSSSTIPSSGNASLTPGSNITISASSASGSITAPKSIPFLAVYVFEGDSTSGLVQVYDEFAMNGVFQARAAASAGTGVPLTGVTLGPASQSVYPPLGLQSSNDPAFNLVFGVTFSANGAGASANVANLSSWYIEA